LTLAKRVTLRYNRLSYKGEAMHTVVVSVIGIQRDQAGEKNRLEMMTAGRHYQKNNIDYIRYDESAISGLEGTHTTLKIMEHCLVLLRMGTVEQKMVFQQGLVEDSLYHTPFGDFQLSVRTNELKIQLNEGRGTIQVDYELMLDGQWQSANQLMIEIREDRKS
jgi:uncharacterized beta-barrel protein YwiB (DUF1934 family)